MIHSGSIDSARGWANRESLRLSVLGICLGISILFWSALKDLFILATTDDRYIEIMAAPLISLYLVYWDRKNIFSKVGYSPRAGIAILSIGIVLCFVMANRPWNAGETIRLAGITFCIILVWQAAFVLCYGTHSFRAALYPLCCLWLAVPIPAGAIDSLSALYQQGSAAASYAILEIAGVSVLRDGTSFAIPGLDFTIAPECSGIRSGIAFLMVAIFAGGLYLRSASGRSALILLTLPIAMFKNAVRIVVTTSLGAYVDRAFIDGPFHHRYGGFIFAPVDFLLFVPLLIALRKLETYRTSAGSTEKKDASRQQPLGASTA